MNRTDYIATLQSKIEEVLSAVRSRNADQIGVSARNLRTFCVNTMEFKAKLIADLNFSDSDSKIWESLNWNEYYGEWLRFASGLFPSDQFKEEHIAEVYEWCAKISNALSLASMESVDAFERDSLLFEILFELYNHMFPNHLSDWS